MATFMPHGLRVPFTVLALALAFARAAAAAGADGAPATQEVRKLVESGKYRDALKQIAQHLGTKPTRDASASAERYELLSLKGESLLQLGERKLAITAFSQAARAAPEPRLAAIPRATTILLKKSTRNRYVAKAGPADGIDIVSTDSRRAALAALHADMSAELLPKFERAVGGRTLPPMMEAFPSLLDLAAVEYAATGSASRSREVLKEFGGHARQLMEGDLKRVRLRIESLDEAANTIAIANDQLGRRGLHTDERTELRDLAQHSQRIADTVRKVRTDARQLGLEPSEQWDAILAEAVDNASMANDALSEPD